MSINSLLFAKSFKEELNHELLGVSIEEILIVKSSLEFLCHGLILKQR